MSLSRRQAVAGLCAALCPAGRRDSRAADDPPLEPDEGIVLCSWGSELPLINQVEFRQFHSRPTFSFGRANPGEAPAPSTAKLGQYYFYACGTVMGGKGVYKEPADERSTFEVLNGVVNYIGDWFVSQKGAEVAVHLATIARAKTRFPWLERYQLFVAFPGRESSALSWGQLPEPAGKLSH